MFLKWFVACCKTNAFKVLLQVVLPELFEKLQKFRPVALVDRVSAQLPN
jgi:hypothetical protein